MNIAQSFNPDPGRLQTNYYFDVSHAATTLRLPRARTQLVFGGLGPPNPDLRLLLSRRRR
ncbi:hypothetical protein SAMN05444126_1151, partial [Salisediminibacterium halotolerans]